MDLEVLHKYSSFAIHTKMPKAICRLQKYIVQDGFLIFYTGQTPDTPICSVSFPLNNIDMCIDDIDEEVDCLNIFHKIHKLTYKIYAHKNSLVGVD